MYQKLKGLWIASIMKKERKICKFQIENQRIIVYMENPKRNRYLCILIKIIKFNNRSNNGFSRNWYYPHTRYNQFIAGVGKAEHLQEKKLGIRIWDYIGKKYQEWKVK